MYIGVVFLCMTPLYEKFGIKIISILNLSFNHKKIRLRGCILISLKTENNETGSLISSIE